MQNWLGLEGRGHEVYYGVVENIPNVNQVIILWGPVFSVVTARALRDDTKKRLCSRLRPLDYELSPFFLRDSRASERRARVKSCLPRVGWFWRALAFRSLFYPWGKHVHTYPVNPGYESASFWIRPPELKFLNTLWIRNREDAKSGYFFIRWHNKIEPSERQCKMQISRARRMLCCQYSQRSRY